MARLSRAERKRINARASAGVATESGVLPASPLLDEPADARADGLAHLSEHVATDLRRAQSGGAD